MKPIQIHPVSVLVGVVACLGAVLLTSQIATRPTFPSARFTFGPHPRDFVTIREGLPYTVPSGMVFIPTAIGNTGYHGRPIRLLVNGAMIESATTDDLPVSMATLPRAIPIAAGSLVEVQDATFPADPCRAWGYLAAISPQVPTNDIHPRIAFAPSPADMLVISEGSIFTVPAGKVFVPTALGPSTGDAGGSWLLINGHYELFAASPSAVSTFHREIPDGLAIPSGSTIAVSGVNPGYGVSAWGYLADV